MPETLTDVFVAGYPESERATEDFDGLVELVGLAAAVRSTTGRCRGASATSRASSAARPDSTTRSSRRTTTLGGRPGTHDDARALHEHASINAVAHGVGA